MFEKCNIIGAETKMWQLRVFNSNWRSRTGNWKRKRKEIDSVGVVGEEIEDSAHQKKEKSPENETIEERRAKKILPEEAFLEDYDSKQKALEEAEEDKGVADREPQHSQKPIKTNFNIDIKRTN